MYHKNAGLAVIYIVLGSLMVAVSLGDLIYKLSLACLGLYLIHQGLAMRGTSALHFFHRWFDRIRYY